LAAMLCLTLVFKDEVKIDNACSTVIQTNVKHVLKETTWHKWLYASQSHNGSCGRVIVRLLGL